MPATDIICITGSVQKELDHVAALLGHAGMATAIAAPKASAVEGQLDLARWHQQVMAADKSGAVPAPTTPGRLWEQLAGDIFVANMQAELWGWADTSSTWTLDFWHNFEPNIKFMLVCVSPQQMLTHSLAENPDQGDGELPVEETIKRWLSQHQEMLRFHNRHPQRSMLVAADDCLAQSEALLENCRSNWQLNLTEADEAFNAPPISDAMLHFLADQCCHQFPQLESLMNELAATMTRFSEQEWGVPALENVVADYRQLLTNHAATEESASTLASELEQERLGLVQAAQLAQERQNQIEQVQNTLNSQIQQNQALNGKLEQAEQEHAALNAAKTAAEKTGQDAAQKLKNAEQTLSAAEQKLIDSEQKLKGAEQAGQDAALKLKNTEQTLSTAEQKLKDSEQKQKSTDQAGQDAALKLKNAEQTLSAAEQKLIDSEQKLKGAIQQNQALNGKLEQAQQEHAALNTAKTAAEKTGQDAALKLKNAEQTLSAAEQKLIDSEQKQKGAEQALKNADEERRDSKEENELLLLQLHQVQEELEHNFLGHQEAQQLKNQLEQMQDKLDSQIQQNKTLSIKLEQAQQEHVALNTAKIAAEKVGQDAALKLKNAEQTLSTAGQKLKDSEQKQKGAEQALKNTEEKRRDSFEENELLLLQLHQVQEELEHYFLRHQEAQQQLQQAEDNWQQMMQRNPDFCDYESLELIIDEEEPQALPRWRFSGLNAAGRRFAELQLHSVLEQGIAGLVFARQPEPAGVLLRWPVVAEEQDEVCVIPVAQDENRQLRVETLFDLSSADWALVKVLAQVMARELASADSPARQQWLAHECGQLEPMQAGLGQFREILEALPPTFRFDSLSLKHEQVNPGYEHLWLRCENVAYGSKRWPAFEFRLACANVQPGKFGNDPKLEIPQETGSTVLSGWFAESEDNFGEKLELRFAMPDAMDVEVWHQLQTDDQQLMAAVITRLPAMLQTLHSAGTELQRPWDEWILMAEEMARIFTGLTASKLAPRRKEITVAYQESEQ
jgi:hypothetical protein